MAQYWNDSHNEAIKQYYYAESTEIKYRIINNKLTDALYEMASRILTSLNQLQSDEHMQTIVIHLVFKSMPKLSEDKLEGALAYLWLSARNYALTYIVNPNRFTTVSLNMLTHKDNSNAIPDEVGDFNLYNSESYVTTMYNANTTTLPEGIVQCVDLDEHTERDIQRARIMDELDLRLKGQTVINTTNSVFILLLKQYIIDNDYDCRGFGEYVMDKMNLKLNTYRAIAARLKLKTKDFNEKLLGK